jgi:hypothetical protein
VSAGAFDAFRIPPLRDVAPATPSSGLPRPSEADRETNEDSEEQAIVSLFENPASLFDELDRLREDAELRGRLDEQLIAATASITAGISIGYALLLTRGGWLLASLLSSMPAWRLIDPVPILARLGRADETEDDDSLESLVDRDREDDVPELPRVETDDERPSAADRESR